MKVKVSKEGLDWRMWCEHHSLLVWCESQADAYEAAAGHVVMHHPVKL